MRWPFRAAFALLLFVVSNQAFAQAPYTDPRYPGWVYYPSYGWYYQPQPQVQQGKAEVLKKLEGTEMIGRATAGPRQVVRYLSQYRVYEVLLYYPDRGIYVQYSPPYYYRP